MKKLKKLAALLLAGAMAMLLFTACGGSNEDKQAEEAVMKQINTRRSTSTQSLENDDELRAIATKYLNEDIKASVELFGHKFVGDIHTDGIGDSSKQYVTITVTANYEFAGTLLETVLKEITKETNNTNINAGAESAWAKVGVVVKSDNSQKYAAVTVRVLNPIYNKK